MVCHPDPVIEGRLPLGLSLLISWFYCFSGFIYSCLGFNWLEVVGGQGFWAMGLSSDSVSWGLTMHEQTLLMVPSGAALSLSSSSEHPHSFVFGCLAFATLSSPLVFCPLYIAER